MADRITKEYAAGRWTVVRCETGGRASFHIHTPLNEYRPGEVPIEAAELRQLAQAIEKALVGE